MATTLFFIITLYSTRISRVYVQLVEECESVWKNGEEWGRMGKNMDVFIFFRFNFI